MNGLAEHTSSPLLDSSLNAREHAADKKNGLREYVEAGVTYTEQTQSRSDGSTMVTTTYSEGGVNYTKEIRSEADGDTYIRVDAATGQRVETTTTSYEGVQGDIEDYVDPAVFTEFHYDSDKPRGETTHTTSQTSVTDLTQEPPVTTVTQQSSNYSQQIKLDPADYQDDGRIVFDAPHNTGSPMAVEPSGTVAWNTAQSGQTLSFTTSSSTDANGDVSQGQSTSSEIKFVGIGSEGQPVVVSNTGTQTRDASGRPLSFTSVSEERGTIKNGPEAAFGSFEGASLGEDFQQRLADGESPYLDFRSTYTLNSETGQETRVEELGDYNTPSQDGRTVSRFFDGTSVTTSYRKVSEDGDHIQQQTVVAGTDYSNVTDTRLGDNGEYTSTSQTTLEGETIEKSTASRILLYPAGTALPVQPPAGFEAKQWEAFRAAFPNGPVYQDQSSRLTVEDGVSTQIEVDKRSSGDSSVGTTRTTSNGVTAILKVYQLGGIHPQAGVVSSDGNNIQWTPEGLEVNQELYPLQLMPSATVASGSQALIQLVAESQQLERTNKLATKIPFLDEVMFSDGLRTAIFGDGIANRLGGVSTVFGSSQSLWEGFGTKGIASKSLGVASGVITLGLGIFELTERNYAEGTMDILAGGALIVGQFFPPALWVAAAATVARVILDIGDSHGPEHAPLVIS